MSITQIFRPARLSRGNTSITVQQPIDRAAWVWHPALASEIPGSVPRLLRFRCPFTTSGEPFLFDISADERFILLLDGAIVARGPNRASVENWQYQSYRAELAPGQHLFEAICWTIGPNAPLAQLSWKGGFIFCADGNCAGALTTGSPSSAWQVGIAGGLSTAPATPGSGAWGVGGTFVETGDGPISSIPAEFVEPAIVRKPISAEPGSRNYGSRQPGWMLFPTQIPDQLERPIAPGAFRAVNISRDQPTPPAGCQEPQPFFYSAADAVSPLVRAFDSLLRDSAPLSVPPHSTLHALWDLGDYYSAYPVLSTTGGQGSSIRILFHESLKAEDGLKHHRDEFVGKALLGFGDEYRPAPAAPGQPSTFTPLWWRAGRWAEIEVSTDASPVTLTGLSLVESRYPLEREGAFDCDDPTLGPVQKICLRGMQMCCHEMIFDCPFFEQQMYPGDTRIQLLVLSALTRDDRMARRAIEIFAKSARDDGMVPFNFPSRNIQEGATYTLCWLLMFRDFLYFHDNPEWLRAQLPAMRHTLSGIAAYEDPDGILRNLPGWNFLDWIANSPHRNGSWAPGSLEGDTSRGSIFSLLWIIALKGAADVETALGDTMMGDYWRAKARRTADSVIRIFWSAEHGMIADSDAFDSFSEHALSLAIVADILPPEQRALASRALLGEKRLSRASVYFSHYLFEAYFLIGRGDLFLRRLDLWRHYVALGLRTPLEAPEGGKNGQREARSDCHAWGSHPIFWLQSGVAGVMPASPFFSTVRVAPQPGSLRFIKSRVPHPRGFIDVDLAFDNGRASGTITLPAGIPGTFEYAGSTVALKPGANSV